MRRFSRKLYQMATKDYVAQVVELNNLLTRFPATNPNLPATKLPDDKLLNLLEFGVPLK